MGRAAVALFALTLAAGTFTEAVGATASANASARIVDSTAVRINWALAIPTVNGTNNGARFTGTVPSLMLAIIVLPRNGRLMVRRDTAPGGLATAPTSFEVFSAEGENAVLVRTTVTSEAWISGSGVILSGTLDGSSAASIDVAQGLTRIADSGAISSAVRETLTVVVQYN